MTEFQEAYKEWRPHLRHARLRLRSLLRRVVAQIEDRSLVRAELRTIRVKELSSLMRKASVRGWSPRDAFNECTDLVGARVVCNNTEDARRFVELLRENIALAVPPASIQDHMTSPHSSGYRAIHVDIKLDVGTKPFEQKIVPCEVQIRSRLQDAWAELSHDDIYKRPDLPADLRARATDLAELLTAADKIASAIRTRATEEVSPSSQSTNLAEVSRDSIATVFLRKFGRSPPSYVVEQALNLASECGITELTALPDMLANDELRRGLDHVYQTGLGLIPTPEEVFLASLRAVAEGPARALEQALQEVQRQWAEIDAQARREAVASLPESVEKLLQEFESHESEGAILEAADAFGAFNECRICGATIVIADELAEAVVSHYDLTNGDADDACERIQRAVGNSSVDSGGWGDGTLCAYHNEVAQKDD